MKRKTANPTEFEKILKEMEKIKIVSFAYLTDRSIVFEGGNQIDIPLTTESTEMKKTYEFQFDIDGDWDYFVDGKLAETSKVKEGEGRKEFTQRMFSFEDSFKPQSISKISISSDGKSADIFISKGGVFKVRRDGEMFVSYHRFQTKNGILKTLHAEVDEDTNELAYFEA